MTKQSIASVFIRIRLLRFARNDGRVVGALRALHAWRSAEKAVVYDAATAGIAKSLAKRGRRHCLRRSRVCRSA